MYSGPEIVKSVKKRGWLKPGSAMKGLFATDFAVSAEFTSAVIISVNTTSGDAISERVISVEFI